MEIDALALLTVQDVSTLLQQSQSKTWSMIASGEHPSFKLRGHRRVLRSELESWLRAQATRDSVPA